MHPCWHGNRDASSPSYCLSWLNHGENVGSQLHRVEIPIEKGHVASWGARCWMGRQVLMLMLMFEEQRVFKGFENSFPIIQTLTDHQPKLPFLTLSIFPPLGPFNQLHILTQHQPHLFTLSDIVTNTTSSHHAQLRSNPQVLHRSPYATQPFL